MAHKIEGTSKRPPPRKASSAAIGVRSTVLPMRAATKRVRHISAPQAPISRSPPRPTAGSFTSLYNFFTLALRKLPFPQLCGLQTIKSPAITHEGYQFVSSAYSNHVCHGHVLGRAAGGTVCDLFCAITPKDTFLILIRRTLTAVTVALSVPVHMNLISAYYVAWITDHVFTWRSLPEVWRFVSPFFITGPKFGLLMDPYFLWTYASQLELEATRFSQPGDFFTYITFVCSVIMVSRVHLLRHVDAHFSFTQSFSFATPTSLTALPVYLSCDGS
jgi:hypothetical protein